MTEPTGLMFSNSAAAAKLAAAFWLAQIAIVLLRRGATVPTWQIGLSILTVIASTIAWRAETSSGWFIACVLALLMLIDGLRQWMSSVPAKSAAKTKSWPIVALSLAVAGSSLCTYAIAVSDSAAKMNGQPHPLMLVSLVSLLLMFALLLASTLELTIGSLGDELFALPWQRLSTIATFVFLGEILLAGWVITKLKPEETIEMTAAPVIYEFSRLLLGYIAWCVPRRMASLAQKKELRGQASLALSGWIALLCFAVAMALPNAWPWNVIRI